MSELICRKTMMRCQTPGMCAPHGGCSTSAEADRAALVERAVAPAPASGVPGAIGVKRYIPDGYTQPASRSGTGTHMVECKDGDYVLAADYDALAQRCRELESERDDLVGMVRAARIQRGTRAQACLDAIKERDALRAEVERLTLYVEKAQQHALTMGGKALELAAREIELQVEVEQLRQHAATSRLKADFPAT